MPFDARSLRSFFVGSAVAVMPTLAKRRQKVRFTFEGSGWMAVVVLVWAVAPLVPLVPDMVAGWFRPYVGSGIQMQESALAFEAAGLFAAAWFMLGLAPTLMLRPKPVGSF